MLLIFLGLLGDFGLLASLALEGAGGDAGGTMTASVPGASRHLV